MTSPKTNWHNMLRQVEHVSDLLTTLIRDYPVDDPSYRALKKALERVKLVLTRLNFARTGRLR